MRIVVQVTAAHPDLREALSAIPVRSRAERLRTLAQVGLVAISSRSTQADTRGAGMTTPPDAGSAEEPALQDRRQRLIARLRKSQ
jgi:hypothetical protein